MSATTTFAQQTITEGEYLEVQGQLTLLATAVREMPLAAFLAAIGKAETLGPIKNPTLFIQASAQLAQVKALAIAALPLQREVLRQLGVRL